MENDRDKPNGSLPPSADDLALDLSAFLRVFQLRGPQIMWFLGAGASRAARIKTAGDMIWDFKQRLYRSEKKLSPASITDISDPIVQRRLQEYFDHLGGFPPAGDAEEYAAYFEATYGSPRDRRAYLAELIARGKPSFGHLAMALLMSQNLCRAVWTTNFDRTVEDAAAQILGGTGHLLTADLSEPEKLRRAWSEGKTPIYAKLHGDFHSDRLKNTTKELRSQDTEMRDSLVDCCKRQGLAVVGYSGRDKSILGALRDAIDDGRGFPGGLFWFKRGFDQLFPGVFDLIVSARRSGIDAHIVTTESFDELFSDIVRFLPETADKINSIVAASPPRLKLATPSKGTARLPVVRTNALPIKTWPPQCRIIDCKIGGHLEIREAIEKAGVDVDAQRCKDGVLAFGRDADLKRAFEPYGIRAFDARPISSLRLMHETGERSLLRDAMFRALQNQPQINIERRGRSIYLKLNLKTVQPSAFNSNGVKPINQLHGTIPRTKIAWEEACGIRLDFRLDQLWLLLDPTILMHIPEDMSEVQISAAREFIRVRRAARHNRAANAILDGWAALVAGPNSLGRTVRAFGISDGIDAEFEILRVTAFSGTSA